MRQVPILDGISSVIKPQRFTLLLGPPGAGKTTFMRALSGQLKGESKLKVRWLSRHCESCLVMYV